MQGHDKTTKEQRLIYANHNVKKLGSRIKELRIKAGYSSYESFANDHEIPRSQWGRYEKGQDLKFSSLLRVVAAFGISLSDFFKEGFDI